MKTLAIAILSAAAFAGLTALPSVAQADIGDAREKMRSHVRDRVSDRFAGNGGVHVTRGNHDRNVSVSVEWGNDRDGRQGRHADRGDRHRDGDRARRGNYDRDDRRNHRGDAKNHRNDRRDKGAHSRHAHSRRGDWRDRGDNDRSDRFDRDRKHGKKSRGHAYGKRRGHDRHEHSSKKDHPVFDKHPGRGHGRGHGSNR